MEPKTLVDDGKVLLKQKNLATAFGEENALFFTSHVMSFLCNSVSLGLYCVYLCPPCWAGLDLRGRAWRLAKG